MTDTITVVAKSPDALAAFVRDHTVRVRLVSVFQADDGDESIAEMEVERAETTAVFKITTEDGE